MTDQLTVYNPAPLVRGLDDAIRIGKIFAESGLFKDATDAAKAIVKIIQGHELGVGPMVSMRNVYVIESQGGTRIEISAGLMAALVRTGGYDYRVKRLDKTGCTLAIQRGGQVIGEASFTEEEAKAAKLAGKSNWLAYAEDMYFARAMSRLARRYAPEVLMGNVYVEGETRELLEAEVVEGQVVQAETPVVKGQMVQAEAPVAKAETPKNGNGKRTARPAEPETVRGWILSRSRELATQGVSVSEGQRGALVGALENLFPDVDDKEIRKVLRYSLTKFFFEKESSKDLTPGQVSALLRWAQDSLDGGGFATNENAIQEAGKIIHLLEQKAGQNGLPF